MSKRAGSMRRTCDESRECTEPAHNASSYRHEQSILPEYEQITADLGACQEEESGILLSRRCNAKRGKTRQKAKKRRKKVEKLARCISLELAESLRLACRPAKFG